MLPETQLFASDIPHCFPPFLFHACAHNARAMRMHMQSFPDDKRKGAIAMKSRGARRAAEASEDRNAVAKIMNKLERKGGASSGAASKESERCEGGSGASSGAVCRGSERWRRAGAGAPR